MIPWIFSMISVLRTDWHLIGVVPLMAEWSTYMYMGQIV